MGTFRRGIFYAAAPEAPAGSFGWAADNAWLVVHHRRRRRGRVNAKLAECETTLEEVGRSMAEMAYDMQLPYGA
jgi:hypothetical protein